MPPHITRIDPDDPKSTAALQAEQRMFEHYELPYKVHHVDITNPDLRIRVLEIGEGRPVMSVPGGVGDAVFMAPIAARLKGWRLIAINRPGGGMSDSVDFRQVDLRELAVNTIRSVADAFELHSVPFVSNSMGGLWTLWYALAHPERVTHMAQIGCPALLLGTSAPFFMRLLGVPVLNNVIAPNMQPKSVETANDGLKFQGSYPDDIDKMPRVGAEAAYHFFNLPTYLDTWKTLIAAAATLFGANARYSLGADALAQVRQPTQFVWGDNDPFGGLDVAREAVRIMPDARLHSMRAGHLPHLDDPEQTARVIGAFLEYPNEVA